MDFELILVHDVADIENDNIDFRVKLKDGREFWGTFFTLKNIEYLMQKNVCEGGEWSEGRYFWSANMVIVSQLTQDKMEAAIADLINRHLIDAALYELGKD